MTSGFFGLPPTGLKNKIIEVLSSDKTLTTKQIYYKLQRQHAVTSTYQAMHKALKQMLNENILIKEKAAYSINPQWVENFRVNIEQLAQKIKSPEKEINFEDLKENETMYLHFKGILELGWFLVDKLIIVPNPKKKPGIALWRFCYSVVGLEEKHLTGLKKACEKNNWFAFVEENNKVDQMFGKTLLSYGIKEVKYGIKCATPLSDKVITGDFIVEIIYPSFFRNLWAIQNRLPKRIIEFNLAKHLLYMREFQPNIEVIITKNAKLAEEYRKEYLKKNYKRNNSKKQKIRTIIKT